jgi:predicted N-acetyltransferase YhbS
MALPIHRPVVQLRAIDAADVEDVGRIAYEAFADIARRHGFPPDFPDVESARALAQGLAEHPTIWGTVAVRGDQVIGSTFLDERSTVRGVGPVTVDPSEQASGVGRLLMEATLDRAGGAPSVRLLQDSFNTASLALYASLGFEVAEQTAVVAGVLRGARDAHVEVRPLESGDLAACEQLALEVLGFERTIELGDAIRAPELVPVAAHRDGRLVAFASTFADFGAAFAVAESEADLYELIGGATSCGSPASFLLPLHQHEVVRRCLAGGLRIVKPMTYMVFGTYQRPRGAWLPSVLL